MGFRVKKSDLLTRCKEVWFQRQGSKQQACLEIAQEGTFGSLTPHSVGPRLQFSLCLSTPQKGLFLSRQCLTC